MERSTGGSAVLTCEPICDSWESGGPLLAPILRLHQHDDGYVAFSVASDDAFRHIVAIRASELETYFPAFLDQMAKDSYVSINASRGLRRCGRHGKAYGYPAHSTASLRYLCACYCDLDFDRLTNLSFGQVAGVILDYQDEGVIPPASAIVRSGRGLWLMWFLCDPKNPTKAQPAFPEKIDQYVRIQRAVVDRLAGIGADAAARDAVRHVRIPGSFNTAGEQFVKWLLPLNEHGTTFTYTLADLTAFFGVEARPVHHRVQAAHDAPKNPNRRLAWIGLNQRRLRDFEMLRCIRGGFSEGCRNYAALLFAWLLKHDGAGRAEVEQAVTSLASECRPPLRADAASGAVRSAWKLSRISDQRICDWLRVTPQESAVLERWPAASHYHQPARLKAVPCTKVPDRRRAIQAIVAERQGDVPPCRDMVPLLAARGFEVSHVTVSTDYAALDLKTARMRKREAQTEIEGVQLKLTG